MLSKLFRIFFLVIPFVFLLTSCTKADNEHAKDVKQWMENNGKVKILCTTAMIHDVVKEICGDYADSLALIQGELDPHSYQLVKGDDEKILFANLIFCNGLGLEHGPSLHYHLLHNQKVISLGDKLIEKEKDLIIYVNQQIDPHIWMDISIWSKIVPFIAEALMKKDPEHSHIYQENACKFQERMSLTHKSIKEQLQKIPAERRCLVTSHDAFNYFTRAYLASIDEVENHSWHYRFQAPEGLAPDSQLSTVDIQRILNHLIRFNIHVIFPESNVSQDSIRKILSVAKEKRWSLTIAEEPLYGDAMGPKESDGDTYLKMIQHNANVIYRYLSHDENK